MMASLPPRPVAQCNQTSQHDRTGEASSQPSARELTLEDSQTVIIESQFTHSSNQLKTESTKRELSESAATAGDENELPKCWICFQDPSEDDPLTASSWRHPCPCALTAHEACLLDWIADMEGPTGSRRSRSSSKILCPQCKSEIKLSRPKNVVVDIYKRMESMTNLAVIPGLAVAGSASLGLISQWHGIFAIYQIFGAQEASQLLRPLSDELLYPRSLSESIPTLLRHWRLLVGPTLIPPILILSRTTVADSILPIIPMIFFATKPEKLLTGGGQGPWPPSAALSFALLPYIRGAYNTYYDRIWRDREISWMKQTRPRSVAETPPPVGGEGDANHGENRIAGLRIEDEHGNFEIDVRIIDEWEENERVQQEHVAQMAHPLNAAQPLDREADEAAPPPNAPNDGRQEHGEPAAPHARPQRERDPVIGAFALTRTVFGALVFPSIAASVGELLRQVLPASWVTLPVARSRWSTGFQAPTGILQTRWGRSLVGGCLFVVLRDAVRLYVRWKIASMHRERKVLNYDGRRPGSS